MYKTKTLGRVTEFVFKFVKSLEQDGVVIFDAVYFFALDIAQELEENHQFFISGKASSSLAAASLYLASVHTYLGKNKNWDYFRQHRLTQRNFEDTGCGVSCGVTAVTVRNNYRLILEELPTLAGEINIQPHIGYGFKELLDKYYRVPIEIDEFREMCTWAPIYQIRALAKQLGFRFLTKDNKHLYITKKSDDEGHARCDFYKTLIMNCPLCGSEMTETRFKTGNSVVTQYRCSRIRCKKNKYPIKVIE